MSEYCPTCGGRHTFGTRCGRAHFLTILRDPRRPVLRLHGGSRMNACDKCDVPLADPKQGLCDRCADVEWDRWYFDRHDDIGPDE